MGQIKTKNQKLINNVLNLYREIGIDITVSNKFFSQKHVLIPENKKNINLDKNYNTKKIKILKLKSWNTYSKTLMVAN